MSRRKKEEFLQGLDPKQLADILELESFVDLEQRGPVLQELRSRSGLNPDVFRVAYPECKPVAAGFSSGWHDGHEPRSVPLSRLQATDSDGKKVASTRYLGSS